MYIVFLFFFPSISPPVSSALENGKSAFIIVFIEKKEVSLTIMGQILSVSITAQLRGLQRMHPKAVCLVHLRDVEPTNESRASCCVVAGMYARIQRRGSKGIFGNHGSLSLLWYHQSSSSNSLSRSQVSGPSAPLQDRR